jgi:ribose 5-phosphate isomerase B
MRIILAADHAGYALKEHLKGALSEEGHEVEDCGNTAFVEGDDYPEFVACAARRVSEMPDDAVAIVLGGSGQGEAMVANRFPHVRATAYYGEPNTEGQPAILALSREHNNANVLSLGARYLTKEEAIAAVTDWLQRPFSREERHVRRNEAIDTYGTV